MTSELEVIKENQSLTVHEMRSQIGVIHQMLKEVMTDGVHFGVIPGCGDKPTLFKPGAEKILMAFKLVNSDPIVDTLRNDDDEYHVRVRTRIFTRDGISVGDGLGEASTAEEKYAWQGASCDEEYNEMPENKRRIKWAIQQGNKVKKFQVKTNVADHRNTVLKMAVKRSLVAATLNVTAASDCFTQDIEDMSAETLASIQGGATQRATVEKPKPKIVKMIPKSNGLKLVNKKQPTQEKSEVKKDGTTIN